MLRHITAALLGTAALIAAGAHASAADLSVRRTASPPQIMTPVPVSTWTGFYAGANVGYGWSGGPIPPSPAT